MSNIIFNYMPHKPDDMVEYFAEYMFYLVVIVKSKLKIENTCTHHANVNDEPINEEQQLDLRRGRWDSYNWRHLVKTITIIYFILTENHSKRMRLS